MSQPRFSYPGIMDYQSASYTLSHGTIPGKIQVRCVAGTANPAAKGTARFIDPTTGVTVQLPDCIVDSAHIELSPRGDRIIRFDIFDQRWRWRFGRISGQYNLRNEDGSQILPGTEKTPRELAKLCFDAMGIDRGDVSKMPNKARPFIDWDVKNPSSALASLADTVGCSVVLKTNGRVSIEPIGVGKNLPFNAFSLSGDTGFDPPELPLGIEFVAGATKYQVDFELEAVGEDFDGSIKPIDDLSYKPANGWSFETPWMDNVGKLFQELAQQSVYKMYRIKIPKYLPGVEKKRENKLTSIDEVLPLLDAQNDFDVMPDDSKKRRKPWVYGLFAQGETTLEQRRGKKPEPDLENTPDQHYKRSFEVDHARGIVIFSEQVYDFVDNGTKDLTKPADIRLRVAVNWRRPKTRALEHWTQLRGRSSARENPIVINRSDVALERKLDVINFRPTDNEGEVKDQAKFYLDQAVAELQPRPIGSAQYVGIHPIEPDGAIRQVSWSIMTDGSMASKTVASLNTEQLVLDASYEEKRLFEKVQQSLILQQQNQQAKGVGNG